MFVRVWVIPKNSCIASGVITSKVDVRFAIKQSRKCRIYIVATLSTEYAIHDGRNALPKP